MAGGDTEKTEKATAKRKNEARNKGQVAVSKDLNRAFQMMICLVVFNMAGYRLFEGFSSGLREHLGNQLTMEMTDRYAMFLFENALLKAFSLLFPFFAAIITFMIAINFAQVGIKISTQTIKLSIDKLNPINGIKKLFSLKSLVKIVASVLKVAVLALVVYFSLRNRIDEIGGLGGCDLEEILSYCFSLLFLILFRVGVVLIILGLIDYMYQKWNHEKELRMTKQEVKEERKQMMGDPKIKSRIRQIQFGIFKQRMMQQVPESTVVVTNPTTYAVAIKYERGEMNAPLVVAKGMNLIADKIKSLAKENDIPLVENKALAQTLYRTVGVGDEVPQKLYRAMAEVLTYVYKLKDRI